MARLIDATRIEQYILNNCSDNEEINAIYAEIINAPTVNAIEVVWCKYCKWYLASNEKCGLIDTRLQFYTTDKRWTENSYCCWGERKDEVEE